MKKIKPRIYLLMENKKRELDARIYFALKASLSNFSIVIARKAHIFDNRKRMQKGIVIFKSLGSQNLKWIKEYKRLGFIVGAIDEEGLSFFTPEEYTDKIEPSCIENIDIFFCWGQNDYNAIIKTYPMMDGKIYIIGNSRIDILKKPLNKKYFKKAENIKKKEGDFILVNTMFTKANNFDLIKRKQNYIDSLIIEGGRKPDSLRVKFAKPYLNFQEQNLKLLKNFLNNYSTKYPNEKIIIRPHPGEYSEMWKDFAKNKKNIKVSIDQINTCSWIIASKKQITSNCTTSIEGYFLNRIAANYIVFENEKVEFKLPKLMSINIRKDEDLIKYLKEKNDYKIGTHNIINIEQSIHNTNNKECSVKYFIDSLNANEFVKKKINSFFSEDKFSGFFYSIFLNIYYYVRYFYRYLFTKQDKVMDKLIMQKFPRLDVYEIEDTLNQYKSYLEVKEKIKLKQIYPQVFSIEKE